MPGRLIILSGPSCVGKSPLSAALGRFYPNIKDTLQPLVLYNDRNPRPAEKDGVDYYFRSRSFIEALKADKQFVVLDVRGDLQALDLNELSELLGRGNVFFEGNPFVGSLLLEQAIAKDIPYLSIFMSPISRDEILYLRSSSSGISLPGLITDIMRRKLLRRTRKQKGEISVRDLENIEKRASSAYRELGMAHKFSHVIANHDGEDSENWDAFYYPLGDALKSLRTFVALYNQEKAPYAEHWEQGLMDSGS